jgi:CubicO group peptidase (beta-lactamase class C family)
MRTPVVILLFAIVLAADSPRVTTATPLSSRIDALIGQYAKDFDFMGSVLVADHGEVLFAKGYGLADAEAGRPNTPETKFMVGSITKQFTAMLIMQLVEQGKLTLNTRVSDVLPSFPKDVGERISIEMLLSHRSGLRLPEGIESYYHLTTQEEFIQQVLADGLRFPPGTRYGYSNAGYHVLAMIIEQVTGRTYEEVLEEQILRPLGMSNTGCNRNGLVLENCATSYVKLPAAYVGWSETQSYDPHIVSFGSGFIYSTVYDLFRFGQALCSNRLLSGPYTDQFLQVRAVDESPRLPMLLAEVAGRGSGVVERCLGTCGNGFAGEICQRVDPHTSEEQTLIWHNGTCKLFKAYHYRFREQQRSIIILSNCSLRGDGDEMALRINELLDGRSDETVRFKRDLMQYVEEDVAMHAGVEAAISEFVRLKADTARFVLPEVGYMIAVGQKVAVEGDRGAAISILRMITEEWPQSWEAQDALGEIYVASGEKALAAQCFRRSLELNAEDEHAKGMLNTLEGE